MRMKELTVVVATLWSLTQENHYEFEASLSYKMSFMPPEAANTVRPCFKKTTLIHPQNEG